MRLLQTLQTSYTPDSYVLDACLCNGTASIALSTSEQLLRLYDSHTTTFLFDLTAHTRPITDLVAAPSHPSLLYSAQSDAGVMLSDLRQGRPAHFFTALTHRSVVCNSVSVSPSGQTLAVATDGDIHLVESRTWGTRGGVAQLHTDEITRLRFLDHDDVLCSAGEDQLINFVSTAAGVGEDDCLLRAHCCGEVITKMHYHAALGQVAMVGSCENGYLFACDLTADETRFTRPDYATYLVDWCVLDGDELDHDQAKAQEEDVETQEGTQDAGQEGKKGGTAGGLHLLLGRREDDGEAGPLSALHYASGAYRELRPTAHRAICRVALGIGERLVTGGEDGLLAFWARDGTAEGGHGGGKGRGGGLVSLSSAPRGVRKALPPTGRGVGRAPLRQGKRGPAPASASGKGLAQLPRRMPGRPY